MKRIGLTLSFLAQIALVGLPLRAGAQTIRSVDECAMSYKRSDKFVDQTNERMSIVAICGSRNNAGSKEFNEFWDKIARDCQKGLAPSAVLTNLGLSELYKSGGYIAPKCEFVERLVAQYKVSTSSENMPDGPGKAAQKNIEINESLKKEADGGSVPAKFMLAVRLMDLGNKEFAGLSERVEGAKLLGELAKAGYKEQVYSLIEDLKKKNKLTLQDGMYRVLAAAYKELGEASDPRGYIGFAEYQIWHATDVIRRAGGKLSDIERGVAAIDIIQARDSLQAAEKIGETRYSEQIEKLKIELTKLAKGQITPKSLDGALLAFGAAALIIGLMSVSATKTPPKGGTNFDPCIGVKEAVMWDPSLAAPYALGGCAPY